MLKEIHLASKDLNKELDEYNMVPYFTYIFFFFVFFIIYIKNYLKLLFNKMFKQQEETK